VAGRSGALLWRTPHACSANQKSLNEGMGLQFALVGAHDLETETIRQYSFAQESQDALKQTHSFIRSLDCRVFDHPEDSERNRSLESAGLADVDRLRLPLRAAEPLPPSDHVLSDNVTSPSPRPGHTRRPDTVRRHQAITFCDLSACIQSQAESHRVGSGL